MKHTAKKILAVLLTAALLVGTLASFAGAWYEPNYKKYVYLRDVPKSASDQAGWSYDGIYWCVANGIMSGLGNVRAFEPDRDMTRAMYTQLCYNLVKNLERDMSVETQTLPFTDLHDGAWYMDAMTWAYENGVIGGMGGGIMAPDASITREQIAQLLYNLLTQYFKVDLSEARVDLAQTYRDAGQIGKWAQTAVSTMTAIGLYQGDNGNFRPNGKATRAQIAVLAERLYRYYSSTWQCYLDPALQLVPTMIEDFDGEGKQGWRDDIWGKQEYPDAETENKPYWQLPLSERMYTQDGMLYMTGTYPEHYYDDDEDDEVDNGINHNNGIAGLDTGNGRFNQTYGYYEIRFKPSQAAGFISTFWTVSVGADRYYEADNPAQTKPFVEMDIFETLPHETVATGTFDEQRGKFFSTGHWNVEGLPYQSDQWYILGNRMKRSDTATEMAYAIPDSSFFDGQFHTVGYLWTQEGYAIYYDGNLIGTFPETPLSEAPSMIFLSCYYADDTWPNTNQIWFDPTKFGMTEDEVRADYEKGDFTAYIIDYIHVYQLAEYMDEFPPHFGS